MTKKYRHYNLDSLLNKKSLDLRIIQTKIK